MAVKIRLMRMGAKKAPFYRVVVADSRSPRDGRFLENLGIYHPNNEPSRVEIDTEKAAAWLAKGAQPTEAVAKLLDHRRGRGPGRAQAGRQGAAGDPGQGQGRAAPRPPAKGKK